MPRPIKPIPELRPEQIALFKSKVDEKSPEECWNWKGYLKCEGAYGLFHIDQVPFSAHRVALFIHTKEQGPVARHSCDNGSCCNPNHLSWGTTKDNIYDMMSRNRHGDNSAQIQGDGNGRAKLTKDQVILIRQLHPGVSLSDLAHQFSVSIDTIRCVVNRHSWRNI